MKKLIFTILLFTSNLYSAKHPFTIADPSIETNNEFYDSEIKKVNKKIKDNETKQIIQDTTKKKVRAEDVEQDFSGYMQETDVQSGLNYLENNKLHRSGRNVTNNTMSGGIDFDSTVSSFTSAYDTVQNLKWNVQLSTTPDSGYSVLDLQRTTAGSGHDIYTIALLHFNVDLADDTGILWSNNNSTLDTSIKKLGAGSRAFDGTQNITTPSDDRWLFHTGDFSVDFWVYFNDNTGTQVFLSKFSDPINRMQFYKWTSGLQMNMLVNGGYQANYLTNTLPTANAWHHIEFTRSSTTGYIFLDGVSQSLTEDVAFGTHSVCQYASNVRIGELNGANYLNGRLDEFRVSTGIARHTANFTPPTTEYTRDYTYHSKHIAENIQTSNGIIIDDGAGNIRLSPYKLVDGVDISTHTHDGTSTGGMQVDHINTLNKGDNTHAQIDTRLNFLGVSTETLKTRLDTVGVDTATLRTDLTAETSSRTVRDTALGVSTGSIKATVTLIQVDTGTLQGRFDTLQTWATAYYALNVASQSVVDYSVLSGTAVFSNNSDMLDGQHGSYYAPAGSDYAYLSSTQTFTADQTIKNNIFVSSSMFIGSYVAARSGEKLGINGNIRAGHIYLGDSAGIRFDTDNSQNCGFNALKDTMSIVTQNTTKITINSDGKVGIGNTDPKYLIDGNGGNFGKLLRVNNSEFSYLLKISTTTGNLPDDNGVTRQQAPVELYWITSRLTPTLARVLEIHSSDTITNGTELQFYYQGGADQSGKELQYLVQTSKLHDNTGNGAANDGNLIFQPFGGNVGISSAGVLANILTVARNSATDPIADSWTTYTSKRAEKNIISTFTATEYVNILDRVDNINIYEYTKKPPETDKYIVDGDTLTKNYGQEFTRHHKGIVVDEVPEILNEHGNIDLFEYCNFLQAEIKALRKKQKEIDAK